MIFEKGIFTRKKEEYDCEFILCPIYEFNRTTYLNLRLLIRTILSIPLSFYLGFSIFFNVTSLHNLKQYILLFIISYTVSFYILQIPHEFIHYLFYSKFSKDEKAKIKVFNRKRFITAVYNDKISISWSLISLIMPLFLISSLLASIILIKGFNIIIYAALWAHLILSSEDILNIFINVFTSDNRGMYELPNDYIILNN